MVLASYRGGLYNLFLALHIATIVAAFAPAIAHPLTLLRSKQAGDAVLADASKVMVANTRTAYIPALVANGPIGAVLVLLSDDVFGFGDAWVSAGIVVWVAICAVVTGMILPAERRLAAGDATAERRVAVGGQLATVGFAVMLWLMIWKPGA